MAEGMKGYETRRTMLSMADQYDGLAEACERFEELVGHEANMPAASDGGA